MEDILAVLEETINKSTIGDFKKFITRSPSYGKWIMCSDYCIDDQNKPNDTASFTVIPYYEELNKLQKNISKHAPTDIKNTRSITQEFINYHNSGLIFHFSFILGRRSENVLKNHTKEHLQSSIPFIMEMLNKWKINTPSNKKYFDEIISRFNKLNQAMNSKSFNVKLIKQIIVISLLSSYVAYILCRETKVSHIAWFSDRDNIVSSFNGIIFDYFSINHHGLCEKHNIDDSNIKLFIGSPATDNDSAKMWYDELIKLPDFITGTLSDYNFTSNYVSKEKFSVMLEGAIADNSNISILRLIFDSGLLKCSRITINGI